MSGLFLFLVVLMFAFNSFSHGTQDLYPTFLAKNHQFTPQTVGRILIIGNCGALLGGILFRDVVGADRAAAGDCDRGAAGDSGDSAVGVFAQRADAGAGRVSDLVHGAGCVGSDSGAFE